MNSHLKRKMYIVKSSKNDNYERINSMYDEIKHKIIVSNHDCILNSENNLIRKAKADIESRKKSLMEKNNSNLLKSKSLSRVLLPDNKINSRKSCKRESSFPILNQSNKKNNRKFINNKSFNNISDKKRLILNENMNFNKIKFSNPLLKSLNIPKNIKSKELMKNQSEVKIKEKLPKINFESIILSSIHNYTRKNIKLNV